MASESTFTGKSVDEAIEEGLRALGLTADRVDIEIIHRGSRGIFGLGSEPAQVRITPRKTAAPHPAAVSSGTVDEAVETIAGKEAVAQESAAEALPTSLKTRAATELDEDGAGTGSG